MRLQCCVLTVLIILTVYLVCCGGNCLISTPHVSACAEANTILEIHIFVSVLFVMVNWPGSLVARKIVSCIIMTQLGQSGNCSYMEIVRKLVWSDPFYISIILYYLQYFILKISIFYHWNPQKSLDFHNIFAWISLGYIVKSVDFSIKSSIFVIFRLKSSVFANQMFRIVISSSLEGNRWSVIVWYFSLLNLPGVRTVMSSPGEKRESYFNDLCLNISLIILQYLVLWNP